MDDDDDVLFFGRVYKCSVEKRHTHTERERERNVLLCVRKSALLFPDQKIGLFSRFFCTSTEEEEGKERETKEREGFFRFKHLSLFFCVRQYYY